MGRVVFRSGCWTLESVEGSDCAYVARNLRIDDLRELAAASLKGPAEALADSVKNSDVCYAVKNGGWPVMVLGVAPMALLGDTVCCWAVATNSLRMDSRTFLRHSRAVVNVLNSFYPVMVNYVGAWNRTALR